MDHAQIFRDFRVDVYRLAVCYTRSREEAEDVCQTVFLILLEQKNIASGKEKQWLMKVAANECRNLLRSHWWRTTVPMEDTISVEPPQVNETLLAVLSLEPKYRIVVYLHYYEMLSTEEIGKLLHITRSAVTTRLSRARAMLKSKLKED